MAHNSFKIDSACSWRKTKDRRSLVVWSHTCTGNRILGVSVVASFMAITQQQLFTKGASSANNGNNQSLTKVSGENKKDIEKGIQNNTNLSSNQNVKTKNNNKENQTMASADLSEPLHIAYPVNTIMELTLAPPHDEVVRGLVYTTDEISNSIVLKRALPHTTITCEIRILNASSVINKKVIQSQDSNSGTIQNSSIKANESSDASTPQQHDGTGGLLDSAPPLPAVSKKSLDERERRALKLAEESFAHINQKVSLLISLVVLSVTMLSFLVFFLSYLSTHSVIIGLS